MVSEGECFLRASSMTNLPETVLQFGSGKFLRAFADLFLHHANAAGQAAGRVVVVQTTGDERAHLLNEQGGRYHVLVRGLQAGQLIDRVEVSASISRALVAREQWQDVLALARSPELRYILSNTAEAGYELHPSDTAADRPPASFPAKLLLVLKERFEAGRPGVAILPCELFERNAELLRSTILKLAETWHLAPSLCSWIASECVWLNALVDRIVVGKPREHPLLATDGLLVVAEPYALWALEAHEGIGSFIQHPAIVRAQDIQPYFLRKVRILNAAHTAMVSRARPRGIATVREAVEDPEISKWLDRLLFEEIVPLLEGRVEAPAEFARQTLERFRNPFLDHKISDIAIYHDAKVRIRLIPTRDEFVARFGRTPTHLEEAIAAKA
jgi:tagaturonate reductase